MERAATATSQRVPAPFFPIYAEVSVALGLKAEILSVTVQDSSLVVGARITDATGATLGDVSISASDRSGALDALRVAARKLAAIQTGQVIDL